MQIMKLMPAVCVVALGASFISVHAEDTPVQAAARAALEQKMSEIDTNQTQPPPVVVTPAGAAKGPPSQPATKTIPAKATTPAASVATPAPAAVIPAVAAPVAAKPQSVSPETV